MERDQLFPPPSESRRYACLAGVLSEAMGATCGAECASAVASLMSGESPTIVSEVIAVAVAHRIAHPKTYGARWARQGLSGAVGLDMDTRGREIAFAALVERAAEAWRSGMVPR